MLTLKPNKLASLVLVCTFLLSGCGMETASSDSLPDGVIEAPWTDLESDCASYYGLFLKLGSLTEEEVGAELSDAVKTTEDTKTTWEYMGTLNDCYSYSQDSSTLISNYTKTFPVVVDDISSWVNKEVSAFNDMFDVEGKRQKLEGVTWAWEWTPYLENCKLQVYSTGVTGQYTALISFTRQGETTMPGDIVVDERGGTS